MDVSICLVLLALLAANNVHCYECETQVITTQSGYGFIQSPGFPGAFPDGPYSCTYEITNPSGSSNALLLEFTDFLTQSNFRGVYESCKTKIRFTPVNPMEDDEEYTAVCNFADLFQVIRSGAVTVTFEVQDKNTFGTPGFKIKYSQISAADVLQRRQGRIAIRDDPYKRGLLSNSAQPDEYDVTSVNVDIVRAYPGYRVDYVFPQVTVPFGQRNNIVLQFRDGPTSDSPLIEEFTSFASVRNVYSSGEYLYVKFTKHYWSFTLPGSYVYFREANPCPAGFFRCSNNGYCIGLTAVCDDINHCGDNSDENGVYISCSIKAQCDGDLPCQNSKPCYDGTRCECGYTTGYSGDKCEYGWNDYTSDVVKDDSAPGRGSITQTQFAVSLAVPLVISTCIVVI